SAPAFAAIRTEWIARAGGFQAEHATGGSGNADRAATIAGMGDRKNARGDRGSCAAGGAAGRMREIPGVAGRAVQARLRGRHQTELRARALSENGQAGIEKAPGEGAS